jgi:hypothetical protein
MSTEAENFHTLLCGSSSHFLAYALIDIFSVGGHFDRNNIITFGLASTIISLLGLCIGYLTLRAMK